MARTQTKPRWWMLVWAIVSLVLGAVWGGGWWGAVIWNPTDQRTGVYRSVVVGCGVLELSRDVLPPGVRPPTRFQVVPIPRGQRAEAWNWLPHFVGGWRAWELLVPLWMPLILTVAAAVKMGRRGRMAAGGRCPGCGYDLSGNTTGICPECGAPAR